MLLNVVDSLVFSSVYGSCTYVSSASQYNFPLLSRLTLRFTVLDSVLSIDQLAPNENVDLVVNGEALPETSTSLDVS